MIIFHPDDSILSHMIAFHPAWQHLLQNITFAPDDDISFRWKHFFQMITFRPRLSKANVIMWDKILSSGIICYRWGWSVIICSWYVIIWDEMLSSGTNVIMWDENLSSRANVITCSLCYHLEQMLLWDEMLSSGMKWYHLEQMLWFIGFKCSRTGL